LGGSRLADASNRPAVTEINAYHEHLYIGPSAHLIPFPECIN